MRRLRAHHPTSPREPEPCSLRGEESEWSNLLTTGAQREEATVPYRVRMRHGRTNDEDCLTGSRRELVAVLLALAATSSWWHACR